MNLLPSLRGLLFAGRQLKRIADAAERIADRMDGKAPPLIELPEAVDTQVVAYTSHETAAAAYASETRLREVLGRDPSPEEILDEMEREEAASPLGRLE